MIQKMLKEKNNNNKNNDKNDNQNKDNNDNSNITNLDENISSNKDKDKDNEYKSVIFNSSIPEVIQGTVLIKKEQNEDINEGENDLKEKEQKPRKLSYEH